MAIRRSVEHASGKLVEAVRSVGATPMPVILHGVLSQVVPQLADATLNRWGYNFRASIVMGLVGVGGIGSDEGAPIQELLQMLLDHDDRQAWPENLSGYIQMLLQQFGPPDPSAPAEKQPSHKSRDLDALSPREQQVLELIARGLTYEEVGGRLNLSLNTVKFHIKNIYSKLNVNNRFKAVERAKQKKFLCTVVV